MVDLQRLRLVKTWLKFSVPVFTVKSTLRVILTGLFVLKLAGIRE